LHGGTAHPRGITASSRWQVRSSNQSGCL
jgi:hypothetical protein